MGKIKNRDDLLTNTLSSANKKAREIVLDMIEKTLEAVNPERIIRSKITLDDDILKVNEKTFDLSAFKRIYVVGGGKASGSMAQTLEEILGDRIEEGLVVVPRGTAGRYEAKRIKYQEASHPIPDNTSVDGARKILNLVSHAQDNDLVICVISGGGSSLMALPREGITLSDKQRVTDHLLKSGAAIGEINMVRKHISSFKGGQLASKAYPATLLSLLLSDVTGDPSGVIASGPTAPDSTTFNESMDVLKRYNLWVEAPKPIRKVLSDGVRGLIHETPKGEDPAFKKTHNIVIGNNRLACTTAVDELARSGLKAMFLTSCIEGEARVVGSMLASIAREIETSGNPYVPPIGVIAGGETTVTVTGNGIGGRNQEICLAAALKIDGLARTVVASVSTDGVDGPTESAGALVDGRTISRSRKLGLNAKEYLLNNDSHSFFSEMGGLIDTGPTGTNVNDISVLILVDKCLNAGLRLLRNILPLLLWANS
jgi:glycerate-2-kinase